MPDNDLILQGKALAFKDRAGVRIPGYQEESADTAAVAVGALTAVSSTVVFASTTSRQRTIRNTGTARAEISPTASFAWGAGWVLDPGEAWSFNYSGNIYGRVLTGTGELRQWVED